MADDFRDLFKNWTPGDDFLKGRGENLPPDEGRPAGDGRPESEGRPAADPNANPYHTTGETENRAPRALNEKEVKVMGIWATQDPENPNGPPKQTFVMLRDNRGRRAPIFIGPFETLAIQMALEGALPERPLTHDLMKIAIDKLGGSIERITIDDLWQGTFYAKITVAQKSGEVQDIDCRPSDAIALALRARAPIYMAEDVIETAGRDEDDD